jgi:hypothetical protein
LVSRFRECSSGTPSGGVPREEVEDLLDVRDADAVVVLYSYASGAGMGEPFVSLGDSACGQVRFAVG